ncbi:tetratricopeptide repeat protein [Synechococcus moorigangaii CMS01]|nr:tetratricopeptide repeat protein [Synechococcus moorigangaii CMS01]
MRPILTFLCSLLLWLHFSWPSLALTKAQISEGDRLTQTAIQAAKKGDLSTAEKIWSDLIEEFPQNPALWSNRGNTRAGLTQFDAALADLNEAIRLASDQVDSYFNRGAILEQLQRFPEAIADYDKALALDPQEAIAYHNRGNAYGSLGNWEQARQDYQKATELDPRFAWAAESYALALYQVGEEKTALNRMKAVVRKYPLFADARVALTAMLWGQHQFGEAESNWVSAAGLDERYRDLTWLKTVRRFPPKVLEDLENFFTLQ